MRPIRLEGARRLLFDRLAGTTAPSDRIPPRPVGSARAPLSFAQERLWFVDQFQPGLPLYTMLGVVEIPAPCEVTALRRALDELVRRHEALRTIFASGDDEPTQLVLPPHPVVLATTDLRGSTATAAAREAAAICLAEARQPFVLESGPLFRPHLVRLPGDHELLVFGVHHIVSDGWSMSIMRREIERLYRDAVSGVRAVPAAPPLQYADYAIWQREHLTESRLAELRRYWRDALESAPALSLPPPDRPAPRDESGRGANQSFAIDAALASRLAALAEREQVTLFMVLLAALVVTLQRQADAPEWVIGTPVANRDRVELEQVVGFFVNTLPLRVRVDRDASVRTLLRHVKAVALSAFEHQALPFDRIVDAVQPERQLGHNPIFQVMFALQNLPDRRSTAGAVATEGSGAPEECVARFAQGWFLAPDGDRLVGSVEYATDLYEHARIAWSIEQFRSVLAAFAAGADTRVAAVTTISEGERRALTRWSTGGPAHDKNPAVHESFARQAAAHPHAVAVVAADGVITYAELDRRSTLVAAELQARGVGADDRVAIALERDSWLAPAVLGVLKAGGACVPIDPALPAARIALMLEDAGIATVITTTAAAIRIDGRERVNVDGPLQRTAFTEPPCHPERLAYVVYTSGSTGTPKGVAMTHRALSNLIAWETARGRYRAGERTTLFAPIGFDVAFQEIFSAWTSGGTLVIAPAGIRADPERLAAWLIDERIDRAFLPPLVLRALAEAAPADLALRELVIAGEALEITRAVAGMCQRGRTTIVNEYGPAETHVATAEVVGGEPLYWEAKPDIGVPIDGHCARVLASDATLAPIGCPGELYLAGPGVARGYIGKPAVTADRFIPDPYGPSGARMYRTGDRARWRPKGTLEFLGRVDAQVKIRGFRVEPAEVEAVLRAHAAVVEAAVAVVRPDETAERALAAFVEAREPATERDLKSYLRDRLPEYMIPRSVAVIDRIPRSANGKIDRRALAAGFTPPRMVSRPPEDAIQRRLVEIWSSVLGHAAVGIDDDFFDLGGHSLLATQVVSRIRRELGAELPVRALFEAPTIAALANHIVPADPPAEVACVPAAQDAPVPLSFAQERLWFLQRLAPGDATYNLTEIVAFDGRFDAPALEASWQDLATRHPSLRTTFVDAPDGPRQIATPWPLAASFVDISEVAASMRQAELERIRERGRRVAFDLTASPPVRAVLASDGASKHWLVLTLHHILADGWSMPILRDELQALYAARRDRRTAALPPPPLSSHAYAARQRAELDERALDAQVAFWRRELEGAPTELALPLDRPRNGDAFGPGGIQTFRVTASTRAALAAIGRSESASPFMVLLAASAALLRRCTGQDDLLIGTPVANRTRAEFERTIGFFVNTLVLRIRLRPGQTFRELVRDVRERLLAGLAHQDVPFERVVQELKPERDPGIHPLFQVMCVLNTTPPDHAPGDVDAPDDTLRVAETAAKFDLTLAFDETTDGLTAAVEYRSDRLAHASVWRLLQYERRLLDALAADADAPVDGHDLITIDERRFALDEVNLAPAITPRGRTLHELIALGAVTHGDNPAVEWCGETMAYGTLWRRASELARRLRRAGVGHGDVVGVLVPRSPDWIVATVGVLAAGATYLPIEVSLPEERIQSMVRSAWGVVVTGTIADVVAGVRIVVLPGDLDDPEASGPGEPRGLPVVHPRSAAYVIHTSGSTGEPRGVVVEHDAAVRYAAAAANVLRVKPHL